MAPFDLRPLGVGEILDRAVTLFVRRYAPLVLILSFFAAPAAILQFIAAPGNATILEQFTKLASLPPGHAAEQRQILEHMTAASAFTPWTAALFAFAVLCAPLTSTACTIGAARAYTDRMPPVRELFREALRCWLPQIVTAVAFIGLYFIAFFGFVLIVAVVALAVAGLAVVSKGAALAVGIPLAIAVLALLGAFALLVFLAWQLAFVSIAVEDRNPVHAIAKGVRRAFGRSTFWRSLLAALVVGVISFAGSFVISLVAQIAASLTHLTALYPIVIAIGSVTLNGLLIAYMVVYSYDVRVRREGYDLTVALDG